jgi:hypothetical protein
MKRWLALFGILTIMAVVAFLAAPTITPPIVASYDRVHVDMVVDEVIAIMGEPTHRDCEKGCVLVWEEDGYRVMVSFPNNIPDTLLIRRPRIISKEIKTPWWRLDR